jgi:hypothetical protein
MQVKRQDIPSQYEPIKSYKTELFWCSDGWVYDTFSKTRQRFKASDSVNFYMEEEATDRIALSDVQQSETVYVTVYQENPRMWMEEGDGYVDRFCVVNPCLENR